MTFAWQQFYWPVLLMSLAGVMIACANLARPWWSRLRAGLRLAIDLAIVVIAVALTRMSPLVDITAVNLSSVELEKLRQVAQAGLTIAFHGSSSEGYKIGPWASADPSWPNGWRLFAPKAIC
jgi:hypothetical protein